MNNVHNRTSNIRFNFPPPYPEMLRGLYQQGRLAATPGRESRNACFAADVLVTCTMPFVSLILQRVVWLSSRVHDDGVTLHGHQKQIRRTPDKCRQEVHVKRTIDRVTRDSFGA